MERLVDASQVVDAYQREASKVSAGHGGEYAIVLGQKGFTGGGVSRRIKSRIANDDVRYSARAKKILADPLIFESIEYSRNPLPAEIAKFFDVASCANRSVMNEKPGSGLAGIASQ